MSLYSLRAATDDDEVLLYRLYAVSRYEEMSVLDWEPERRELFLTMQYRALRSHYRDAFPEALWSIVQVDGHDVGMVSVIPMEKEIRLGEMVLMPEVRGRGICTDVVRQWCAEGVRSGRPVRLHVERTNGALSLYQRLGFVVIEELPAHFFMEWKNDR